MSAGKTMKAAVLMGHGGPDKLQLKQVPIPVPKADEVLIKVKACSINNTDINTRTGWYTAKSDFKDLLLDKKTVESDGGAWGHHEEVQDQPVLFPRIQGADILGEVVEEGSGKGSLAAGTRVLCFTWIQPSKPGGDYRYIGSEIDGGFAEYVVVPRANVFPIKSKLSDQELSTIPCAYSTAMNLICLTQVTKDDTVLIRGASGGVGNAAIQLCRARGAKIAALVRESKVDQMKKLGVDYVIPTDENRWTNAAKTKFTVVIDVVGGPDFTQMMTHMPIGGRYATAGAIDNPMVSFDLRDLIYKDTKLYGGTRMGPEVFQELMTVLEDTDFIQPNVARVFPLDEIHEAQKFFQDKKFVGKVVIQVTSD